MRVITRALLTTAVVGTVAALSVGASMADRQTAQDDSGMPSAVEDFSYPGAAKILADRGIKLISGDGHLMLVNCVNVAGLIEVHSFNSNDHGSDPGHYCFQVSGPTGYLKLELVDAYQVKGDNHAVQATVTVDGQSSTVSVAKNGWTGIGVGAGTDSATLLELKASS
ncbi:hypothetical protein [Kutzneria chonburiensis]|uniref:Secreted protein n=1 Tax=Kutzneria chonburiensis TaxID=1483604 RepID=A0ABV6MNG4_9PSEU|nr:hypothetical protein [Kutzneria chonburiensis]